MAKFKFFESAKKASSQAEAEAARKREEESAKAVDKIEAEERKKLDLLLKGKFNLAEMEKGKLKKALEYSKHPVVAGLQEFANAKIYDSLTDEARKALRDKGKRSNFDSMVNDFVVNNVRNEIRSGKPIHEIDENEMVKRVALDISRKGKESSHAGKDNQLQKFPFESERGPFIGRRGPLDADPRDAKLRIELPKEVYEEKSELHHVKAPEKKKDKK